MELTIYQVDAFTNQLFGGNPAAICPLEDWLPDDLMQQIALENNLSETAFIVPEKNDYRIRWFTPAVEVNLCGHATLAAAHVYYTQLNHTEEKIVFHSKSGPLTVVSVDESYVMNFPTDNFEEAALPEQVELALGPVPTEFYRGRDDFMAVFENQKVIESFQPNFQLIAQLPARGLLVTAPGENVDFVSRGFFPASGINEDPVTGSAHTTLTPYWSNKLGKKKLSALQLSSRGGMLECEYLDDRVNLKGQAITYLKGQIYVNR